MQAVLLVPGIMGTRLILPHADDPNLGSEIWPPTPAETQFGYNRIDELQDERVVPGGVIYNVLCFKFYSTVQDLVKELGFKSGGKDRCYFDFAYDWRRDLFDTADALARKITEIHLAGAQEIILLAHSMGGLVSRLVLESGKFDSEPWFGNIRMLVSMAVPHLGAPLALARIFGTDNALGIRSADFTKLARNPKYPSGYQLIPAPGEMTVWDIGAVGLPALDIYDPDTARKLGMEPKLVERARAVHDVLSSDRQPSQVRYFYFGGSGHKTATRVNVYLGADDTADHSRSIVTRTPDGGDGTVPLYSALAHRGQRQIVFNEHSTVFSGTPFKRVLFRLLGSNAGLPIEAESLTRIRADAGPPIDTGLNTETASPEPYVRVSVDGLMQKVSEPVEVNLSFHTNISCSDGDAEVVRIAIVEGKLILDKVEAEDRIERGYCSVPVNYTGAPVERLTMYLPPQDAPGIFILRFRGNLKSEGDARYAITSA